MAITYSIAPNPHWVVIDNFSKLPVGAAIYTYSSLNPSMFKPAFQDAGGAIPFGQPIVGFGNGTFPPIFWEFDSNNPTDTYYIQVWSGVQDTGADVVMLWDFNGLSGGGSGGGGVITTNLDLENLIINGQFYSNIGNLPLVQPGSVPTFVTLAPSNHEGFAGTAINPAMEAPPSPDIIFAKGDTTATDSISFVKFPPGSALFGDTPTPEFYVNYTCSIQGSESFKVFQFPIVRGLQNLNNIAVSVQMWNQFISNSSNVSLRFRQFCGNGNNNPSDDVITPIGSLNFSGSSWTLSQFTDITIPSIAGLKLGNCGNDALFMQIVIPSGEQFNFNFILLAMYLGAMTSLVDFHTLDFVDGVVNSPRTGDTRTSLNAFQPYGWVPMNDGTIGNASSNATTRRNVDTFPLFDLIWTNFQSINNQFLAPMLTNLGVPADYGTSSWIDFSKNNQITLTRNLGRVMEGTLPVQTILAFTSPTINALTVSSTANLIFAAPITISNSSDQTILQNVFTYYLRITSPTTVSVFPTFIDAINNTNQITFAANAITGNIVFPAHQLGSAFGNEVHTMTLTELVPHTHGTGSSESFVEATGAGLNFAGGGAGFSTQPTTGSTGGVNGNAVPFNILQPTVAMNVFMKL